MTDPSAVRPNRAARSAGLSLRPARLAHLARLASALLLASALAPAWLIAEVPRAAAADPITFTTASTFQFLPAANKVHVTVNVTVHNNKRDTSTAYYYVSTSAIAVDAEELEGRGGGEGDRVGCGGAWHLRDEPRRSKRRCEQECRCETCQVREACRAQREAGATRCAVWVEPQAEP